MESIASVVFRTISSTRSFSGCSPPLTPCAPASSPGDGAASGPKSRRSPSTWLQVGDWLRPSSILDGIDAVVAAYSAAPTLDRLAISVRRMVFVDPRVLSAIVAPWLRFASLRLGGQNARSSVLFN
ncbi:hypothetical protein HU200_051536 [Digitaria exilis]|uniref:Uncharacterized protein n=1 Tax=Digitaria exilis TaxID=1010633 RepID=A0A835E4Y0_9POAL|nr:hypothetical protein HU200_051536 [Digitaria exilis]